MQQALEALKDSRKFLRIEVQRAIRNDCADVTVREAEEAERKHEATIAALEAALVEQAGPIDPNEDPSMLWAEIWRLRAALQGPDGYVTWKDAAVAERLRRVAAERKLAEQGQAATADTSLGAALEAIDAAIAKQPQPLTELPPMPKAHRPRGYMTDLYTAEQMRDYGRAVEAEMLKRRGVQR